MPGMGGIDRKIEMDSVAKYGWFSYLRHLFEYIGTQFPPPSSLLYGKMGSIKFFFFFKWEY